MRVLYSDNGSLTDITTSVEKYASGTYAFSYVTGEDFIYIGNDVPFNHVYVKLGGVVNAVSANAKIEYWNGREWIEVVELRDETNAMSQSGFIDFVPDRNYSWDCESTNYQGEQVTGLEDVVIYDLYWMRLSFDQTLTSGVVLAWAGNLFCDDQDLYSEKPVFNSSTILTHFKAGKTDWEEQRVKASELIVKDLKSQRIIISEGQILKREDYRLACISKTAQIIFGGMGDDYKDDLQEAKDEYKARLDLSAHIVDTNNDGIVDKNEKFSRQGWLSR